MASGTWIGQGYARILAEGLEEGDVAIDANNNTYQVLEVKATPFKVRALMRSQMLNEVGWVEFDPTAESVRILHEKYQGEFTGARRESFYGAGFVKENYEFLENTNDRTP